jgi:hypothetical protein
VFAQEALAHNPNYQPQSVNLDGWEATAQAWQTLFPGISIILCFLYAILKVGQYCRSHKALWTALQQKLWRAYRSANPRQMAQRLRQVREWCQRQNAPESVRLKVQSIASKAAAFNQAFTQGDCYRTSNQVDRMMNFQDHWLRNFLLASSLNGRGNARPPNKYPQNKVS